MATTFPTAAFPAVPPASTPAIIAASRLAQMIGESSLVAAKIVARQTVTAKLVTKKKITALKIFLHLPTPQPPASPPNFRGEN